MIKKQARSFKTSLMVRLITKITFGWKSPSRPARLILWKRYTVPRMANPARTRAVLVQKLCGDFIAALFIEFEHPNGPEAENH